MQLSFTSTSYNIKMLLTLVIILVQYNNLSRAIFYYSLCTFTLGTLSTFLLLMHLYFYLSKRNGRICFVLGNFHTSNVTSKVMFTLVSSSSFSKLLFGCWSATGHLSLLASLISGYSCISSLLYCNTFRAIENKSVYVILIVINWLYFGPFALLAPCVTHTTSFQNWSRFPIQTQTFVIL